MQGAAGILAAVEKPELSLILTELMSQQQVFLCYQFVFTQSYTVPNNKHNTNSNSR